MAFGSNNPKVVVEVVGDSSQYNSTIDDAVKKTSGVAQQFKQVGSNLSQIGRSMTAYFTVPIVAAATIVGNEFVSLDQKMRNIQSISGQSDQSLEQLRQTFIKLSQDQTKTTETASALAEAYYFIQSAGFEGAEGISVLEVATKAASAGLTDTQTAATAIMGVLHAYGMEAKDAGAVSDVLFKTVDQGVITFEELADGLGRLTNTGAIAGVSIQEIGAAMVVLTRKGMPAAEAFTALNQVMSKLAAPTDKILKAAKDLGIDISFTALKTKGFGAVLTEIAQKGDEAFFSLFGNNVRALKGIAGLATEAENGKYTLDEYNEALRGMGDAAGRTSEAFNAQTKSLSAQMAFIKNDLMAVGMTLLQIVMPYLMQFVEWLGKAAEWVAQLSPTTQKWIVVLLVLLAVVGPLLMILGSLVTGIGAVITIVGAITAPIWIAIAVIAALIAIVVLLYIAWKNNWGGIQEKTAEAVAYLKNLWGQFMNWFQMLNSGQLGAWSTLWKNTWNSIKLFFQGILDNIKLLQQAWMYARQGDWYNFGATLRQIWDNNWNIMKQILQNAWNNISTIFSSAVTNIRNWWSRIDWSTLGRDIGWGIYNGLSNMGSTLYAKIVQIGRNMLNAFKGFWGISSPSKLMAEQFGYLAQGAIIGWDNNFAFSPSAVNQQMMSMYSSPSTTYSGESNGRIVSLLEQLNNKDSRIDEGVLVRAFRDAVLLLRD
jgi:TP901 family phage tail tape measure protein